jgi:sirohydrochlorin ferrochelatase
MIARRSLPPHTAISDASGKGSFMRRVSRVAAIVATVVCSSALAFAQPAPETGILLLAHGGSPTWNGRVKALAAKVDASVPVEVAFGMATRTHIQSAVDKLAARGVKSIVAVPLFVSSHSSVVTSTAYLLGLRADKPADLAIFAKMNHGGHGAGHGDHAAHGAASAAATPAPDPTSPIVSPVPIRMTPALGPHRVVSDILASRAKAISTAPGKEAVILVAHGPSPEAENALWLADMNVVADRIGAAIPFASIDYLTVRDDAEKVVRDSATAALRAIVSGRIAEGRRVLIVPQLMSFGGIEQGIRKRLEGLEYTMSTEGLMPDDRLADWVLEMAYLARGGAESARVQGCEGC